MLSKSLQIYLANKWEWDAQTCDGFQLKNIRSHLERFRDHCSSYIIHQLATGGDVLMVTNSYCKNEVSNHFWVAISFGNLRLFFTITFVELVFLILMTMSLGSALQLYGKCRFQDIASAFSKMPSMHYAAIHWNWGGQKFGKVKA